MSQPLIDYLIVSHNELPYLKLVLWSIKTHNRDIWDTANIKVFDSSSDGTQEWCDKYNIQCEKVDLPDVFSTWNYAVSVTNNPLIIFSTSDHIIAPNFWKNILEQWRINPDIHSFTGTCLDNGVTYPHEDNIETYSWPSLGLQLPTKRRWFKRDCGDNWKDFSYDKFVKYVEEIGFEKDITLMETGYCPVLTTRENFNFVGGFDLSLKWPQPADTDFLNKMMILGRRFCIVDSAFEYHFSSAKRTNLEYDWKKL